jgi:glycosyltransferase involved in cell wall biosynthesis
VTIHDVFHLAMPEYTGGLLKRVYARLMFAAVVKKAHAILCVSCFTAVELTRLTGISAEKLNVILLGVDESWYHIETLPRPESKPYLLYVGNVKPHKNLSSLVEAFAMLVDVIPHDLIIVGKKDDLITADKEVECQASRLGDRVRFTGLVGQESLQQYFVHADALVFPSLYEGFGLPPLEAMACGCPVIVSNRASLPEVCGEAAVYCNPEDPSDIAEKIRMVVMDDSSLRETMRQHGHDRAKRFTWEKCARETVSVIEKVLVQ